MLRLKINLRVRRAVRVKCPRHPCYNPERDGATGAIRAGCRYCLALYELYADKIVGRTIRYRRWNGTSRDVRRSIRRSCERETSIIVGAGIEHSGAAHHR